MMGSGAGLGRGLCSDQENSRAGVRAAHACADLQAFFSSGCSPHPQSSLVKGLGGFTYSYIIVDIKYYISFRYTT